MILTEQLKERLTVSPKLNRPKPVLESSPLNVSNSFNLSLSKENSLLGGGDVEQGDSVLLAALCNVRDKIAEELQALQDDQQTSQSLELMQNEMGLVQLLGLANQLIFDGDVSSAVELGQ